jgi:hypothetical protein
MASILSGLANSKENIQKRVDAGVITRKWPVLMLFSRLALFALCQAAIAGILFLVGRQNAWDESAGWWPVAATTTNVLGIILLIFLTKKEGMRLTDLYKVEKHNIGRELLIVIGLFILAAPILYLPNVLAGTWLYGDMNKVFTLFFRPLPLGVVILLLALFPVTIALVELPTYYGYIMPRLAALTGKNGLAVLVAALFHALQHCALPLIFDGRFMMWRLLMFIPFGLLAAFCLNRRPRLLPYMMVIHGLLDLQLVIALLALAVR